MKDFLSYPIWFMAVVVLVMVGLTAYAGWVLERQICLGPLKCFGFQGGVSSAIDDPKILTFRSDARPIAVDDSQSISHNLDAVPDLIQVWSSKNEDGPWDLVDSVLAHKNQAEGIWITNVTSSSFDFVSGVVAPHSTHGNGSNRNGWEYYGTEPRENFDPALVWFRFTALAFCIEDGDCKR